MLKVHIPSRAVFVFMCGYNNSTYSAIGVMVGDGKSMMQSVLYVMDVTYNRYQLGIPIT